MFSDKKSLNRIASFIVLLAIIIAVSVLFYVVMSDFILPIFMAILLVVVFHPVHDWIVNVLNGRRRIAAFITTTVIMLIVLIPAIAIVSFAIVEAVSISSRIRPDEVDQQLDEVRAKFGLDTPYVDEVRGIETSLQELDKNTRNMEYDVKISMAQLKERIEELASQLPEDDSAIGELQRSFDELKSTQRGTLEYVVALEAVDVSASRLKIILFRGPARAWLVELANPSEQKIRELRGMVIETGRSWVWDFTGKTTAFVGKFAFGLLVLVVSMFFFLADGQSLVESFMRLSPLDDRYEQELFQEFDNVSRAVVLATVLSAIAQALIAGLGFWVAGITSVFLLTCITFVCAMIPFVGAAAVWVPVSAYLYFYEERTLAAVLLAIYGATLVSMSDNVIKPLVLHGQSNLHPLIALLSVLGGVTTLGPVGIVVGPMVAAFLQTLLNILHRELLGTDETPEEGNATIQKHTAEAGTLAPAYHSTTVIPRSDRLRERLKKRRPRRS